MAAFLMLDVLCRKERSKNSETKSAISAKVKKENSVTQNDGPCRVCLKVGNIPIFTENFSDSIAAHIRFFADIEVNEDDGLPKHLCQDCHNLLQGALLFRQQALNTDERLRNSVPLPKRNNEPMLDDEATINDQITIENPITNDEPMTDDESITNNDLIAIDDLGANNEHMSNDTDDERDWKFIELEIEKEENKSTEIEEHNPLNDLSEVQIKKGKKTKKKIKSKLQRLQDCKMCIIGFTNVDEYKKHLKSDDHTTLRRPCPDCGKVFYHEYLRAHMLRAHNTINPFVCEVCGKSFAVAGALQRHVAIHSSQLPYKCSECPYRGRFRESLKMHMRVHTGEKPHSCKLCGKRFVNTSNLNMHMFRHTKEARYKCDQCDKGFYLEATLKDHVKVDHAGIKEHECTICGKMFGRRSRMLKHTQKVHKRKPSTLGPLPLYMRYDRQLKQSDKDSPIMSVNPPSAKHACLP